jgi:hypothetical protein
MKLRNGFVSNSSSASYIVRIHDVNIMDFCESIAQEFQYDYFEPESLIERFTDRRKDIMGNELMGKHFRRETEQLTTLIARLEALKEDSGLGGYQYVQPDAELVTDILNQYYRIQTKFYNGDIILTGDSSMHNSICDVPDLLKSICMYYLFEIKKTLECKVEHD